MDISVQQILDYCCCPLLYKFKHINKYLFEPSIENQFENELRKIIYSFYHYIYDDQKIPTLKILLKQWHHKWDGRKQRAEFVHSIHNNSNSEEASRRRRYRRGIEIIQEFYDNHRFTPGIPLLINKDYNIDIGRHRLQGTIPLIREIKGKYGRDLLEMVNYRLILRPDILRRDIETTANSLAFRVLMNTDEQRIIEYSMKHGNMALAKRNNDDYKVLMKVINNIDQALEHKIFYPVYNARCIECPYSLSCKGC